ncbi:bifunctional riboflavin kinase/FAD synthetase [Methylocystis bryophila]|uniref:Riboflavin biosynthesis protein n=1 Tax=Methylocystis bryophila TaxID=655015 RepID=A0A1W6MXU7_9HYPH|nr:bifunctional riboflavin kinase/FAD synthetase [Methylocystis bryophila]ARN82383.1 riboflavin biosynthesis protein RibF [Methylocystis bryophila]BDV38551.1 riboflavin biosynthesis protein [Methylocystis bryophila]
MSSQTPFVDRLDPLAPPPGLRGGVFALGNFDGLHRGHVAVIERAKTLAARLGRPCAVLTFEPHPADFFAGHSVIFRLTPPLAKAALLKRLGLDGLVTLTFDAAFASLPAESFTSDVLSRRVGASAVVAGYDFRFGKGRRGDAQFLESEGARLGFLVEIVERIVKDEAGSLDAVSSTATREALALGDVRLARSLLGRPYFIEGEVVRGAQRGRKLGFPTANIALDVSNRLRHGVYAVTLEARGVLYGGVASFGRRPTFDDGPPLLEVFVFDFDGDLYGETVEVAFYEFLRGEEKFASVEALIAQMQKDAQAARAVLNDEVRQ